VGTDQHAHRVLSGFDRVIIALPAPQAAQLLHASALGEDKAGALLAATASSTVAPCWTLMLAFPHAVQPGLTTLGPQWNAARSQHHRLAWLARESSKPGRDTIERWTVQASADWSTEHLDDDAARVQAKLLKAFAEVTGIRAEPAHADVHRWRYAKTITPLGQTHVLDSALGIGLCGDWCLGHRVENAFVSGRSLGDALA
jgi:renalase